MTIFLIVYPRGGEVADLFGRRGFGQVFREGGRGGAGVGGEAEEGRGDAYCVWMFMSWVLMFLSYGR